MPKGVSNNPNGRPKAIPGLLEKFKNISPSAAETLYRLLSSDDERIQLDAAKYILDRALGKPHQAQDITVTALQPTAVEERLRIMGDEVIARLSSGDEQVAE